MMKTISFLQQPFERFIPAREVEITKTLNFEAYVWDCEIEYKIE
jgi:hypothetical protein